MTIKRKFDWSKVSERKRIEYMIKATEILNRLGDPVMEFRSAPNPDTPSHLDNVHRQLLWNARKYLQQVDLTPYEEPTEENVFELLWHFDQMEESGFGFAIPRPLYDE